MPDENTTGKTYTFQSTFVLTQEQIDLRKEMLYLAISQLEKAGAALSVDNIRKTADNFLAYVYGVAAIPK